MKTMLFWPRLKSKLTAFKKSISKSVSSIVCLNEKKAYLRKTEIQIQLSDQIITPDA